MEAILGRKPEDLEDYYGLLGCDELSSTEQIVNEYKIRALACHPDKHQDNPTAVADFQKLQEAKEVLCDEAKRKNYDLWKRSGISIPFQEWRALNDSVKTSMHWAVRTKKEPMLESCQPGDPAASQTDETSENPLNETALCDFYHQRFRWASDSPSCLLQKFRNYEI
ncbi:PREDICTED: dnaJ homolog subfamily C member 12 [Poecilia mexicana]|uniref:DnaJ homolog subfamily C member 12 n=1 Tax=Poecilia mexicana TaxID=48701 RepID=A0A3B3WRZ7_9TELE|nr:PREDICTED: dnaJ homolog subfamily C member 12 [Poecilia mexicana]